MIRNIKLFYFIFFSINESIVSFGEGCANDYPGIYSKLTDKKINKWIKSTIAESNATLCMDPNKISRRRKNAI